MPSAEELEYLARLEEMPMEDLVGEGLAQCARALLAESDPENAERISYRSAVHLANAILMEINGRIEHNWP